MATMAVRRLAIPCLEFFVDFGIVATGPTKQDASGAFTAQNDILGGEVRMGHQIGISGRNSLVFDRGFGVHNAAVDSARKSRKIIGRN